jgi:hypothetical protein
MRTAIVLGFGPDVEYVLSRPEVLPGDVELFSTNLSGVRPNGRQLPIINLYGRQDQLNTIKKRGITRVISFGSFKLTGLYHVYNADARRLVFQHIASLLRGVDCSDETRRSVFSKFKSEFEFPNVKEELPCLFFECDVAINGDNTLLDKALSAKESLEKDAKFAIDGAKLAIFRVSPDDTTNHLINRRLSLEKFKTMHQKQGVRHFFFQKDRTIIVERDDILAYTKRNALTLQSF